LPPYKPPELPISGAGGGGSGGIGAGAGFGVFSFAVPFFFIRAGFAFILLRAMAARFGFLDCFTLIFRFFFAMIASPSVQPKFANDAGHRPDTAICLPYFLRYFCTRGTFANSLINAFGGVWVCPTPNAD
jgi:hypothetical protein